MALKLSELLRRAERESTADVIPIRRWTLDDRAAAIKQAQDRLLRAVRDLEAAQAEYERTRQELINDIEKAELGIHCTADDLKIEVTERRPS